MTERQISRDALAATFAGMRVGGKWKGTDYIVTRRHTGFALELILSAGGPSNDPIGRVEAPRLRWVGEFKTARGVAGRVTGASRRPMGRH